LQGRLSRDVEETTAELRHVEKSLREFDDSSAARTGK